ncbi:MAG: hypothetical protein IPN42_12480 [Methylococcaceae bacterium]|nr:hypothetical protein [Methylococcaceae bacterium]
MSKSQSAFWGIGTIPGVALISALTLTGCAIDSDFEQLFAEPNSVIVIKQKGRDNELVVPVEKMAVTQAQTLVLDPKGISAKSSQSIAVENENLSGIGATQSLSDLEKAQKTLIRYLSLVEGQPEKIEKVWIDAEQLAQHYPDDKLVQSLWQRLSQFSDWQPVNSIIGSAGIDIASFNGWRPETPALRVRKALLPSIEESEQVILGDQRLVLVMVNEAKTDLKVEVKLEDIPFLPQVPALLLYQVDESPPKQILLKDNDDWRQIALAVPVGEHAIRFYQEKPLGNQFIKLRFDERSGRIGVTQERPYFISTNESPLEFYSQGPTEIRIDELNDGKIAYRYQKVPEGWHTIRLLPPEGSARALYRVSQRVVNFAPKKPNNRIVQRELTTVPDVKLSEKPSIKADKVELIDAFKLGKQQDGTLSAGLDFVRRNNKQESGINLPEEQFMQARANYRYFDEPNDVYFNTAGFARHREFGGPTLGLDESVYYNPDWLPFNVSGNAKVNAQAQADNLEALAQMNLTLSQGYNIVPKVRLLPSVTFFARTLSLDDQSARKFQDDQRNQIDQDVYTPYKSQHKAGFNSALNVQARPWLDTLLWTRVGMGTNEDFNVGHPDHYNTEAHWQQIFGSMALDAYYRVAFYQPDNDRAQAQTRSYAGLEANWQHWLYNQQRLEISAQYSYDIERKANLAMLGLTWHFGEGRGLRDFAPNEIDFRDIRQRQFVNGLNNSMRIDNRCVPPCSEP